MTFDEYIDKEAIEIRLKSNFKTVIEPTNPYRKNEYVNTMILPTLNNQIVNSINLDDTIICCANIHYVMHNFFLRLTFYVEESYDKIVDYKNMQQYIKPTIAYINRIISELNNANVQFVEFESDDKDNLFRIYNGKVYGLIYDLNKDEYIEPAKPIKKSIVFEDVDETKIIDAFNK